MTALFYPVFGHYTAIPEGFALPEPVAEPERGAPPDWATVGIGAFGSAQGPVLKRFRDGRVTIDAAGRRVTGLPVGDTARRSWWGNLISRRH